MAIINKIDRRLTRGTSSQSFRLQHPPTKGYPANESGFFSSGRLRSGPNTVSYRSLP